MALLLSTDLKTTLAIAPGSGNPTLTRATAKTFQNNEGNVVTLRPGAVALAGARVVQNYVAHSEDFTNASWIKGGTATAPAANTISFPTVNDSIYYPNTAGNFTPGNVWLGFVTLSGTGNVTLEVKRGAGGTFESTILAVVLTSTPTVYQVKHTFANSGHTSVQLVISRPTGGASSVTATKAQFENVTGQAVQTAGEYVSVGVLSAPYHGAGTDGVKYFDIDSSGNAIPQSTMRRAHVDAASKTNSMLHCRDLTNAAWVKTNCTAAKTQTGVDGLANACSLLTANSADATCLQTITTAAVAACTGFKVKRSVGTDPVYITRDGGATYTDISGLINTDTFTLVGIENTSVTNPQVGFKIATSGDAIIVDSGRNHSGTVLCEDIFTTTVAVTRNAEVLTYQTSGNFSDTAGTILVTVDRDNWTANHDGLIGSTTAGLGTLDTNGGAKAVDGTNTVNGPAGTPTGKKNLAIRWSGTSMEALSEAVPGTAGTYDLAFGLASIGVGVGGISYIGDLRIYDTALTNAEIATLQGLSGASMALLGVGK